MNRVILMGRMTRDAEVRQTQSGISVARFSIAVNRPFVNKETNQREVDFIECEAWKQQAELIGRYFPKGAMICIEGDLRNNNYEKDGVKHYGMKVVVNAVHFTGEKRDGGAALATGQQPQAYAAAQGYAPQQAPAQGAYNAPYQQQAPARQAAPPAIGINLSEFEDILGGAPPF